jgi:hypothetical protein
MRQHGEAFIRQALYGKRFFRERFDVDVAVGYNVDSFGHAGTLPMLLRHTGSRFYVFMRPQEHEKTLPAHLPAGTGHAVLPLRSTLWLDGTAGRRARAARPALGAGDEP